MSWSRSYTSVEAMENAEDYPSEPRQREQFESARGAAYALVDGMNGVKASGTYTISLSGHAAEEPGPGDCIGVSVSRSI